MAIDLNKFVGKPRDLSRFIGKKQPVQPPTQQPSFLGSIGAGFKEGVAGAEESSIGTGEAKRAGEIGLGTQIAENVGTGLQKLFLPTSRALGAALAPVTDPVIKGAIAITPEPVKRFASEKVEGFIGDINKLSTNKKRQISQGLKTLESILLPIEAATGPKAVSALKKSIVKKATGKAVKQQAKGALLTEKLIKPTKATKKQPFKQLTRDVIAPQLPNRLAKGDLKVADFKDLKTLSQVSKNKASDAFDVIDNIEESGVLVGTIEKKQMLNELNKFKQEFEISDLGFKTAEGIKFQRAIDGVIDRVDLIKKDVLDVNEAIEIRRFLDKEVKRVKVPGVDIDVDVSTEAKERMANLIRGSVRDSNPDYANALDEFRFYKTLGDVVEESATRSVGQLQGGIRGELLKNTLSVIGGVGGATIGSASGGFGVGAVTGGAGGLLGRSLGDAIIKSLISTAKQAKKIRKIGKKTIISPRKGSIVAPTKVVGGEAILQRLLGRQSNK